MTMDTIPKLLLDRFASSPEKTAIHVKRDGKFVGITWAEMQKDLRSYIAVFLSRGIEQGDCVAQFAENRYEWILVDLALHVLGATHVPIHATLSGRQANEQATLSHSKLLLVSNEQLLASVTACDDHFPDEKCILLAEFADDSANVASAIDAEVSSNQRVTPSTIATILYTSGTTGEPKGVMLTQGNLTTNAVSVNKDLEQFESDLRLNFLPLSHIFARTCDLYSWIVSGAELALVESRETIVPDAQAIRPTIMNGVPYFFALLRRTLEKMGKADVPNSINELLGGNLRLLCSGGAAMSEDLFFYYRDQGTPLLQGYGLTESSPVISLSSLAHNRPGASGKPLGGVEVKIADDGEILSKGPHIMLGYFENAEATAAVLEDDGWLHTGDWGHLDEDGFLYVTGRKKELIVTATGKNISPSFLEALLGEDTFIAQSLVVGDDRRFLTALIVPDAVAIQNHLQIEEFQLDNEKVNALITERIALRLADCGKHEQIGKFALLPGPFSMEAGEVTAKLSLRRTVIEANYADTIEALYA